jgi:hypothetical protein
LFTSSCGTGQLLEPTLIPTSTNTPAPANTQTSTITETKTQTPTTMPTYISTFTLNQTLESTQVIVFHPKGVPTQERTGSCWEGSVFLNRVDAWRCTSGDIIYDPCFSLPGNSQAVICYISPLDNSTSTLSHMD